MLLVIYVLAPSLLAIPGCGALTAAKIVGETAGATRFRSKAAYARWNGTAPQPVWTQATTRATDSPAPATARSTPRCTGSRSPRPASLTLWPPLPRADGSRMGNTRKVVALRLLRR